MMSWKIWLQSLYRAGLNTLAHDGFEFAGYLAFLELLAFFPFVVFVVAVAGFVGEGQAGAAFIAMMFKQLPAHMVEALEPRVAEIISGPPQGLLTVSIMGAVWTSSSAVEGCRAILNRAYRATTAPSFIWRRLVSIAQILALSFFIIVAMLGLVLLPILARSFAPLLGIEFAGVSFALVLATLLSALVILAVLATAYYVLPNVKQRLWSVLPGAAIVTLLWLLGGRLLSLYFSQFGENNVIYGSLGGIIAALLFFYINNIFFIYGAEFNYLIARERGIIAAPPEEADAERAERV